MKKIYSILIIVICSLGNFDSIAQIQNLILKNWPQNQLPAHQLFHYPNAVSTQYVEIDFSVLNENSMFVLPLIDEASIQFQFAQLYTYTCGSSSWYGKSINGTGDIIVSFYQGNISANVVDNLHKKYMLQQINKTNLFALTLVNTEGMKEAPDGIEDYVNENSPHKKSRANADVCAVGNICPGNSTIDIMVLGASQAIIDGGGTVPAFTANVTSAITEMNAAITNSGGAPVLFNLIWCDATAFATTADMSNDLTNFSADAGIQALRNSKYADLVSLWAGSGNYAGFCGLGYLNTNPTNYNNSAAYNVCDYGCGMTNLSFSHECGHNMGLRHDFYVDGSLSPCDHHHGYVNQVVIPTGLPNTGRWRTIMAYNNHCSDNGFNCSRLARWSTPTQNYLGDATGRAIGMAQPADEMYGFARFACVVSQFKVNPLPVTLLSFDANAKKENVELIWKTANEYNCKGFDIEIKNNVQDDFKSIGFVNGSGNSSVTQNYVFNTASLLPGTYYFRLKQLDIDNHTSYTEMRRAVITGSVFQSTIYPNPTQDAITITLYNPNAQLLNIAIYDMLGNQVQLIYYDYTSAGNVEVKANTNSLAKGIYFCKIEGKSEKVITKLIIE